jgi:hypothetical protein
LRARLHLRLPLLAAPLLAALALAAAPAGATASRLPAGYLGAMADGPLLDRSFDAPTELKVARRTGVGYVRVTFRWRELQFARPKSRDRHEVDLNIDFTETDRMVLAAGRAGLRVLPVINETPTWAATNPFNAAEPPGDPRDYGTFLGALVRRYGPRGYFWTLYPEMRPRPIRAWQIWNEPNLTGFWDADPWAPPYVRLLREAHRALKRADRGARVIAAGLTNRAWEDLDQLYRAGAKPWFDAAAIHPYTASAANVVQAARLARRVMNAHGDRRTPLLLTEVGWPATRGAFDSGFDIGTTPRGQAARIAGAVRRLTALRRRLNIGSICLYTWVSFDRGRKGSFGYAGLRYVTPDGVRSRPAQIRLRRLMRRLSR